MAETEQPQLYLITPPEFDPLRFPDQLAQVLDTAEVSCVRLALATRDEDRLARAADLLRDICHRRDIALVIDSHVLMVERLGLDGVHLTDGARSVRKVRKALGRDAIVGTFCGDSRHDGISAGEGGADYICFGPVGATPLGDGRRAGHDLFQWWSEMIAVPVVAEGTLSEDIVADLSPVTDFFGIGEEIWRADNPAGRMAELISAFRT